MLRQFLVLLVASASLCGWSTAAAGEAGKVVFVTGQVQLASRTATLDAAVQEGDELSTGADGYIYVKTVDNGFLILRPNTRARIITYQIDTAKPANTRVKLELLSGVARSISGTAVKQARQNFRFNTPVAAIGVRGTDFIVFTDQQTSRVAVVSGGIVVSGFAGGCGPEGGGPCEGNLSRELFAGQADVLLQVQRGQKSPQLLHGQTVAPEAAPPRSDEPVGKSAAVSPAPAQQLNLDANKETALINVGKSVAANTGGDKGNVTPEPTVIVQPSVPLVPTTPPVPKPASPPELQWGRWQQVAELASDTAALDKLAGGTYENGYAVGSYIIGRVKNSELVMPNDGKASFILDGSAASLQETGKAPVAAAIKDAHLDVDFGTRKFATGLTVYTETASLKMNSAGSISSKGVLNSDYRSDATIKGYLGGSQAEQAGYVFKSLNSSQYTAEGATSWKR
ncbi:FecR family protein [Oxalobacteraceae bacterium OTU3CINTB1]|nr:FecR family protein [Oxalobacteraceae bacterium OTU3CINTB1]